MCFQLLFESTGISKFLETERKISRRSFSRRTCASITEVRIEKCSLIWAFLDQTDRRLPLPCQTGWQAGRPAGLDNCLFENLISISCTLLVLGMTLNSSVVVCDSVLSSVRIRLCCVQSPQQDRVWIVYSTDMARTFEFVLHSVRGDMVTSPNQRWKRKKNYNPTLTKAKPRNFPVLESFTIEMNSSYTFKQIKEIHGFMK